jgi:hypothetical protein
MGNVDNSFGPLVSQVRPLKQHLRALPSRTVTPWHVALSAAMSHFSKFLVFHVLAQRLLLFFAPP